MTLQRRANHLAEEKSPYLREHVYNPVDWYGWPEGIRKAKNDNKPIFLSIGYSTCHWCHVMRKESFEDEKIAAVINKNFIPIKVDREERPEIDAYYMNAVQAMTGSGGWPLTVFLTPDLKPFYGGTYFPSGPRYGMPSFRQVLEFVAKVWKDKREEVVGEAGRIASAVDAGQARAGQLRPDLMDTTYAALLSQYDREHGGFGMAPKFPLPLLVSFMLRYHYRTGTELALTTVNRTLYAMGAGGIRDHVGGGFHRYATDRIWLTPHFEKMLYDNALVARVYTEAFQVTKSRAFARVVRETLRWLTSEMRSAEGGFYSAQDADTEEGEGVYYTWTPKDVAEILGKGKADEFSRLYGVTNVGNFEGGRSILHLPESAEGIYEGPEESLATLYEARLRRPRPQTDSKVLTSWNGLAISAFAYAGRVFGERSYLEAADRAADFLLTASFREGRLLRSYAGGSSRIEGRLEDYAYFVQGLVDLFEATGSPDRLESASALANVMVQDFFDAEAGGFFMSREAVPARTKESYDGPTPSGNAAATMGLLRLSEIIGDMKLREVAEKTFNFFGGALDDHPSEHDYMAGAVDSFLNGMKEVVITAPDREAATEMTETVSERFLPNSVTVVATSAGYGRLSRLTPLLEGRVPGKKAMAYVCENFSCKLPADSSATLRAQLEPRLS
jgi:uncharacterized protein YyaL (SSP411 family)